MEQFEILQRLGLALVLGALIGAERGWAERKAGEGGRVAGIRTFTLTSLLGGLWGYLSTLLDVLVLGLAFVAFAILMVAAHLRAQEKVEDIGATTIVAALVTFALGAVAVLGDMVIAAAGAVATTLLLGVKSLLHGWVARIRRHELFAAIQLLAISVLVLPVLPDRGFGPWQALNPFEMWLMVVLIAAISFAGYIMIRVAGDRLGILLAGVAGGLVASNAVTLNLARLGRENPKRRFLLASGILAASTSVFPRTLLVVSLISPTLFPLLVAPLGAATLVGIVGAAVLWRLKEERRVAGLAVKNPFELWVAVQFGLLLGGVILLVRAVSEWFGEVGAYLVAFFSGFADIDAINLSLAREAGVTLSSEQVAAGIVFALIGNALVKLILAGVFCGRALLLPLLIPFAAIVAVVAIGLLVLPL